MDTLLLISSLLLAYLVGAVPVASLVTRRLRGADIRQMGTGNPGAANVYREVGRAAGAVVFFADFAKGACAVLIVGALLGRGTPAEALAGLFSVVGHSSSPFLRFRGGVGVAPALGAMFALAPQQGLVALAVMGPLLLLTKSVGRSVGIGFGLNVALVALGGVEGPPLAGVIVVPLFVAVRAWLTDQSPRAQR